ncbi:MAG TPA: hypothetical protein VGG75_30695 [Trebonia sp.]
MSGADELADGLYRDPGNAGPPTRARYEYQDDCVVLRCIPNLRPGSPVRAVALEWSTDYVLLKDDGWHELVSVKHRDPGQHDWTFARLKNENVFRDMHAIWHAMGEVGDYVFESNRGFAAELKAYEGSLAVPRNPASESVVRLASLLQSDPEEVHRFLHNFFLRPNPLPSRSYIRAVAAQDLAVVMEELGLDGSKSVACVKALADRVAAASTDRPPGPEERVARLTGFIRDLRSNGRTANEAVLAMDELREIVAAASSPTARHIPAVALSSGNQPPTISSEEHDNRSQDPRSDRGRRLAEAVHDSRGRLAARWVAVGLSSEVSQRLADDDSVGNPARLGRELPARGLLVLEGDFGSGKSVTAERIHLADVASAGDGDAPLPVYLSARQVSGLLQDAVQASTTGLGDLRRHGVRLVLDGLDEPGPARAAELLEEARALVFSMPNSRIIATARPGLSLNKEERLSYPPLDREEGTALAQRLGADWWLLVNESPAIEEMLRLPLFLIVALLQIWGFAAVPRSRGTFLDALASAALKRTREPIERPWQALLTLASLTVSRGGTVPAAELGGEQIVRLVLETRLVVRDGRTLRFALPVLEQYFAAQSVLETGLSRLDLHDLQLLDRWRDSLILAVTVGSWDQASALLDAIAQHHPGVVSRLISSAIPGVGSTASAALLPGHIECARQLRHVLSTLVAALGPASRCLGFTNENGNTPAVGAHVDGTSVVAGLRIGQDGPVAVELPAADPAVHGKGIDGSEWHRYRLGHPPADFAAWPWQWGLAWISLDLERLLNDRVLPLPRHGPFYDERRWQLAKVICGTRGMAHRPIDGQALLTATEQLHDSMKARRTVRHSWSGGTARVSTDPAEIALLVQELSDDAVFATDGCLHRPYPAPDVLPPASSTISSLYSDEAIRLLAEQVHTNALTIYSTLVDTWFPTLKPTLGLGCILPVLFTGRLMPMPNDWNGPGFAYEMVPLAPAERSRAEIRLAATEEELLGFEPTDMQAMMDRSLRLRHQVSALRPGTEGWAHPRAGSGDLPVWGDRPATALAYRWLWEDLHALRMVKSAPSIGND